MVLFFFGVNGIGGLTSCSVGALKSLNLQIRKKSVPKLVNYVHIGHKQAMSACFSPGPVTRGRRELMCGK